MKQMIVSALVALTAGFFLLVPTAAAANVFNGVDCAKAEANARAHPDPNAPTIPAVCQDKGSSGNPLTGNNGAIMKIANIIAVIAGVAAVIIIVLSGLKFITSGGEANEVASARKSIFAAVIGLVVIVVARLIIGLVVGHL